MYNGQAIRQKSQIPDVLYDRLAVEFRARSALHPGFQDMRMHRQIVLFGYFKSSHKVLVRTPLGG